MPGTLRAVATRGTACSTGMLSDQWTIPDFHPMDYLPNGVRLTSYSGQSSDLSREALRRYLRLIEAGTLPVRLDRVSDFEEIAEAHRVMKQGEAIGKLVVRISPAHR
ncbi:NADPH:quinone reductase-like Zn-dependent oxidoreductase [Crossiella equi]|uniref:NADPH:quinone reductase-like Zn-dependent oxidoreductase n=1 Tax=Crossiella equi TaxID=130796 RepID=A0ABS5A6P5_9PSEU|nr:zinc-binding dehydrogenase [Crossiella equi]MBP2472263.1 NADPH:quinone reductase-like Zn-dependent oxidoreductase [Crossiella equi]